MSRRYTYAVCGYPGCEWYGGRHAGGHMTICRPMGTIRHQWRRCPFHAEVEWVEIREEEWYGWYFTWDCGTTGHNDGDGLYWRLPPGVSRREWKAIDRARRPEHYARYDSRRDRATGRFAIQTKAGGGTA